MTFDGFEELSAYVKSSGIPSFGRSVAANTVDIARWSCKLGLDANQLFTVWRRRFALSLKAHEKTNCITSSKKFDRSTWELIEDLADNLNKASLVIQTETLNCMIAAAPSASALLEELFKSVQQQRQPQQQYQQETDDDQSEGQAKEQESSPTSLSKEAQQVQDLSVEGHVNSMAYKKLSGEELTDSEKAILRSISSDGTAKGCLLYIAAQALLVDEMNPSDVSTVKLAMSRIVNFISPTAREKFLNNLSDNEAQDLPWIIDQPSSNGLDEDVQVAIDRILESDGIDKKLAEIQTKKAECSSNKQRNSQLYQALSCMEYIVESFEAWEEDANTSEMTYYRKVASILDIIFKNTDIKMIDGESGSASTKIEIEANKAIFHTKDISPSYSRKVDLLLKCNGSKRAIEISSNEWKRASVSDGIKMAQQCKNLRINASILNNLKKLGVNKTMSMDWIGNSGYIYVLEWLPVEEVYIAKAIALIHLPANPLFLADISLTLGALFMLKVCECLDEVSWTDRRCPRQAFLCQSAQIIKTALQRKKQTRQMQVLVNTDTFIPRRPSLRRRPFPSLPTTSLASITTEPYIFFSPKSPRVKRRCIFRGLEDDGLDEDEFE